MNRVALALAVLALPACEMDFGGIFSGDFTLEVVSVEGEITVGPYAVEPSEATVLLYAPQDTMNPVDSVTANAGGYSIHFGLSPAPEVCRYLARARLWDGKQTDIAPLFATAPASCETSEDPYLGADFTFPEYEPLGEPFVVRGRVYDKGEPAAEGAFAPTVWIRRDGLPPRPVSLATDAEGWYRYETTDRATWFSLCGSLGAYVGQGQGSRETSIGLEAIALDRCDGGRVLPDLRIVWPRLTFGRVIRTSGDSYEPVGAGEAAIVILDPVDSTVVVDTVRTLDDGSFHVWLPYLEWVQGCQFLIRATLVSGQTQIRHIIPDGVNCSSELYNGFEFGPASPSDP